MYKNTFGGRHEKKAVGYCRISTLMQVDNTSLKDQENKIRIYAKLHDIVINEIFIDKALSGKLTDRPEYDKMMDYVKVNDIDMIIVYKNDRIHRSLYNLLAMIYELQDHGVALVSVTEMFDTSNPQGMLFLQMLGSFAEFERAIINERTRNGRIARLNENKWVGCKPSLGYKVNKYGQFEKVSEEEVRSLISQSQLDGCIEHDEKQMIDGVFSFNDKIAREIITPRNDMFAIDLEDTIEDILESVLDSSYTRIPVYKDTIDNVVGILYVKDLLTEAKNVGFSNIDLQKILHSP